MDKNNTFGWIDIMKLFLMIGVVLFHSRLYSLQYTSDSPLSLITGIELINYISSCLKAICVQVFFILSGFLFFTGINKFTIRIYDNKLKRRITTLLIPYMIWCTISAVLFIIKCKYLGFNGYEVIVNQHIDWLKWLEGFWAIPGSKMDEPFAFAYWFIRNLMVFVILSPIAFYLTRDKWIYLLFMISFIALPYNFYGFQWFVTGAALSTIHDKTIFAHVIRKYWTALAAIIWIIASYYISQSSHIYSLQRLIQTVAVASAAVFLWQVALYCSKWSSRPFTAYMIHSVFWVYSFHQIFCTGTEKFWLRIIKPDNFITVISCYLLKFITLYGVSMIAWIIARKLFPGFVAVATGNRSNLS